MTAINFAYWLQGFFELSDAKNLDEEQVEIIKRHLNMVFYHDIDPKLGDAKHQEVLEQIHQEKPIEKIGPVRRKDINFPGPLIKC